MAKSGSTETIILNGEVLEWNGELFEEQLIAETERKAFERDGYMVTQVGENFLAIRAEAPQDGTVTLQPKSDLRGRLASSGGHTNFGYSGYFQGYVFLGGRRKRLIDFPMWFEKEEHHYPAQHAKAESLAAIREKVVSLAGAELTKVKGGYAVDPAFARHPQPLEE